MFRGDADWAKGEYLFFRPRFVDQLSFRVHNISDYLPVKFEHKIQRRDKILMPAHDMNQIMFRAAGNIEVIKGLPGDLLYCFVICFSFVSYLYHYKYSSFPINTACNERWRLLFPRIRRGAIQLL